MEFTILLLVVALLACLLVWALTGPGRLEEKRKGHKEQEQPRKTGSVVVVVWIALYLGAGFVMRDNLISHRAASWSWVVAEFSLLLLCIAGFYLSKSLTLPFSETHIPPKEPKPLHDELYQREVEAEEAAKKTTPK